MNINLTFPYLVHWSVGQLVSFKYACYTMDFDLLKYFFNYIIIILFIIKSFIQVVVWA